MSNQAGVRQKKPPPQKKPTKVQAEKGELVTESGKEEPGSQEKHQEREEARRVFQAGMGVGRGDPPGRPRGPP